MNVITNVEEKATEKVWEPKIIAFLCNWCSYAGADLAGVSRIQYPPTVRVIRVMCTGRMNPSFVIKAFQNGADGVLVAGCHPGDCHYIQGNLYARRRYSILAGLIEFLGIERERFMMSWVSASEGGKFAKVVTELTDRVKKLGPQNQLRRP
ncbi:MAG TPA: hydrogenase iron-sulfur subunit [Thermoplasmata archaeon]|nr:hydrogenase iron-sulfur subunit [Thermoplasmata archaeon]